MLWSPPPAVVMWRKHHLSWVYGLVQGLTGFDPQVGHEKKYDSELVADRQSLFCVVLRQFQCTDVSEMEGVSTSSASQP